MDFTKEHTNNPKMLEHSLKLLAEQIKGEFETLNNEGSDCLKRREILMEHLCSLKEKVKVARDEESHWQQKLEEVGKSNSTLGNINLNNFCSILGYQIAKCQLIENNGIQITLYYRDVCYVTYCETEDTFDLIEIFPQYFDFNKVQQFLQKSQDLRGLLSCLRKFFDVALELKNKQEFNKK